MAIDFYNLALMFLFSTRHIFPIFFLLRVPTFAYFFRDRLFLTEYFHRFFSDPFRVKGKSTNT